MGKARYSSHWSSHNPEAAGSSPVPAILLGAVPKVWGGLNYFKFTSEFKSAKI